MSYLYNDEFFQWHHQHAREYSIKTMNWYIDEFKPTSLCDIGCGIGSYLEAAYNKGLRQIKGYDIAEAAKKYTPVQVQPFIEYLDCTKPFNIRTSQFECVISFETAEHIEPDLSPTFIHNITQSTAAAGSILFTAAPPGQQGCGHINCQPAQYWINLFRDFCFVVQPELTSHIATSWRRIGCPGYIADHLLVLHYSTDQNELFPE